MQNDNVKFKVRFGLSVGFVIPAQAGIQGDANRFPLSRE
jgi:hypothetical protein